MMCGKFTPFLKSYSKWFEHCSISRERTLCILQRHMLLLSNVLDIGNEIFTLIGIESIFYVAVEQNL